MRIIAKRTLREFWERQPDARSPLEDWYEKVSKADWAAPLQVTSDWPRASIVDNERVVFRPKGNDYRLVVAVKYPYRRVYARFVGTHTEYDRIDAGRV